MSKLSIEEILVAKPEVRPRIYAYSIGDAAHQGLLKVVQSQRDSLNVLPKGIRFKQGVAEPLRTGGK